MTQKSDRRRGLWITFLFFLFLFCGWAVWEFFPYRPSTHIPAPATEPFRLTPATEPFRTTPALELTPVETFHFEDKASLERWEKKVFKGYTHYEVLGDASDRYLHAISEDSSCGLFMKTRHEAAPDLFLRWKWRVQDFPKKKNPERLASRTEDDFAARVYVIFEASNLFRSDVIEYVWDESIPAGEAADSAYSERIKLFVVRSGAGPENGAWQEETRNLLEDYRRLFGKPPKHPVGIVALMCDSNNTGTSAAADFGDIVFGTGKK